MVKNHTTKTSGIIKNQQPHTLETLLDEGKAVLGQRTGVTMIIGYPKPRKK